MMKRTMVLFFAIMMTLGMCTSVTFAASSPAWSAASPVLSNMDFDNTKNWSKAGTYLNNYTYDDTVVKTGSDSSKYLSVTKNEGTATNQRGDIRIVFGVAAVAGEFDFTANNTSTTTGVAMKVNINLEDASVSDLETALVSVNKNNIELLGGKTAPVTNGAWYRARYIINQADMKATVYVYSLNADGTVGDLVQSSDPTALKVSNGTTTLSSNWRIKRYTVEMYGAPGVSIGLDNLALYNGAINTASFQVGQGGSVAFGSNSITSASKGIEKEVAVGTSEPLSFAIVPDEGFELDSVMVGDVDKTLLFADNQSAVSIGTLSQNTEISVSFISSGTVKPSIVGTPAWGKSSPVVDVIDFDTYTSTWSKAGAYSGNYNYDAQAVNPAGDQTKFLKLTKMTGASGQRGDARITFGSGQNALAGSMDFTIQEGSVNENYLSKINLNLIDANNINQETTLASLKSGQLMMGSDSTATTIQNGDWYRLYYEMNKTTGKVSVFVYTLDEYGHTGTLVGSKQDFALQTTNLAANWWVNRYTIEMYAKEGSGVGFDNFVLYDRPVQFVSFDVNDGGLVSFGEDKTVETGALGYQSEVVIDSDSSLAFAVDPDLDYEIKAVKLGDSDLTLYFEAGALTALGKVTQPSKVTVEFSYVDPREPNIVPSAIGVITSDSYYPLGQTKAVFAATVYATVTLPSGYTYEEMGAKLTNSAGITLPLAVGPMVPSIDGTQFGVKVYGPGLMSGETYTFTPYLTLTHEGQTTTFEGEEQSFEAQ